MSRLIVVSNRVSAPRDRGGRIGGRPGHGAVGGAAQIRRPVVRLVRRNGRAVHRRAELRGSSGRHRRHGRSRSRRTSTNTTTATPTRPCGRCSTHRVDLTAYERSFGEGYERVNRRFAEVLAPLIEPDDIIWVHDYHLIPLARELRRLGVTNRIGFFLHTPWPARQLLVTLPHHRRLVESMFDFDLIGFHTREWRGRSNATSRSRLMAAVHPDGVIDAFGRRVQVGRLSRSASTSDGFLAARDSVLARKTYDRMAALSGLSLDDRRRRPAGLFQGAGGAAAGLSSSSWRTIRPCAARSSCCR